MEFVYRDALAYRLRGEHEYVVDIGDDRLDIVVEPTTSDPVAHYIEVKRVSTYRMKTAIGQLLSYPKMLTRFDRFDCRLHLLLSSDPIEQGKQRRQIEKYLTIGAVPDEWQITTEVERDLPNHYSIGGLAVPANKRPRAELNALLASIKNAYSVASYLAPKYRAVITDLCSAIGARDAWLDTSDRGIVLVASTKAGTRFLSTTQVINAWLLREHYRWVSRPQSVGGLSYE